MTRILDDEAVPRPDDDAPDPFGIVGKEIGGGKYRVVREIGQGGMGVVYEVVHKHLGTRFAAKFIKMYGIKDKEVFVERFMREAKIGARLKHPGIVSVMDLEWFSDGATPYLVMEFLEGKSLGERLRAGGRPVRMDHREAFDIVMRACDPLGAAHTAGIIHRDLKPDNIFLCSDGTLKLLDFGIARLNDEARLTRTGLIMGTPLYMSREQIACAKDLDGRADTYSLGVVLYHAIAGRYIFDAGNQFELLAKLASEKPTDIRSIVPSLPEHFASVVRRAMQPERADRFRSIADFKAALAAALRADGLQLRAAPTDKTLAEVDSTRAPTVPEGGGVPQPVDEEQSSKREVVPPAELSTQPSANRSRSGAPTLILLATLCAVGAVGWFLLSRRAPATALSPSAPLTTPNQPTVQEPTEAPTVAMLPAKGRVRVVTRPPGATVSVAGREVGRTPLDLDGTPDEMRTVRLTLDGYAPKEEAVMLTTEGGIADIELKPNRVAAATPAAADSGHEPRSSDEASPTASVGWVSVFVAPFATVKIDGKMVGETPIKKITMRPGAHVIQLDGDKHERFKITVEPGRHERIQRNWLN